SGPVVLRAEAERAVSVGFLLSDGTPEWRALGDGPELAWDAAAHAPGTYWICAVATAADGVQAASELVPVRVA
ncbi:MAG TPA: hypothetical protein VNT23_05215, partial [Gaiellaceae bacterium]|nr:hypothetical protein [Gaiellaceae bacterium]